MLDVHEQHELIEKCSIYLECFSSDVGKYSFRCPYCGDSRKSKHHKHGNFFIPSSSDSYVFHCYRCGVSRSLISFLKENCPDVYRDFIKVRLKNRKLLTDTKASEKKDSGKMVEVSNLSRKTKQSLVGSVPLGEFLGKHGLKPVTDSTEAIAYLNHRRVNDVRRFYYVSDSAAFLYEWTGKVMNIAGHRGGIVMPCFTDDGTGVLGFVIRLIRNNVRYLNGKFADEHRLIWGLDRINIYRPVIVTEGVFDAAVLPNAIAGLKSDLRSTVDVLNVNDPLSVVVIHDNDWRYNRNTKKHLLDTIDAGYRVVILPKWFPKDINEAVQNMGRKKVYAILKDRVYHGFEAKVKLEKSA